MIDQLYPYSNYNRELLSVGLSLPPVKRVANSENCLTISCLEAS